MFVVQEKDISDVENGLLRVCKYRQNDQMDGLSVWEPGVACDEFPCFSIRIAVK